MDLSRFPRRRYTPFATPLEPLPHFTAALGAQCPPGCRPEIWIKRDDQLGLFPGGNKTRKLEFLVADALAQGADTLITCGAPQSNHCRITLAAAVREGLRCRVVIEERVPGTFREDGTGNHFLFRLMGVESLRVVAAGSDMSVAMQEDIDALAREGRRGYVVPGGGSNAVGGLGYVACVQELLAQSFEHGVHVDHIIVGSGSSGTHGGMVAGVVGYRWDVRLTGIGVSRDPDEQVPLVWREAQAVHDLIGTGITVPREAVVCVGGYWQPKYSVPNQRMVDAVQWLARSEGVLLDPVYTGKVMAGLIGLARSGHFRDGERVVFMHTGGLPGLHAYEAELLGRTAVAAP